MKHSFEGIGQWAATFAASGEIAEGQVVKISSSGEVSACVSGEAIAGVVLAVARDGAACSVALGGMATAPYTGTAIPTVGWCALSANGTGGVTADSGSGNKLLVVDVDTAGKTVTFVL